jgi:hypothetical protein
MKHKAGLYRFERSPDLFAAIKGCQGDTLEIRLTEKEANTLLQNQLFKGWDLWDGHIWENKN